MSEPATAVGPALLLIDQQNAYFETPELAAVQDGLVERANQLIRAARLAGRPVLLARTQHARDRSTWTINMLDDDDGFAFPGTEQAAYLPGLDTDGAIEIIKTRDDAFYRTPLQEWLTEHEVSHVIIGGVSTHSCVAGTAMAGSARDLHVSIAGGVIASENATMADAMLAYLTGEMRQPVLDQSSCVDMLQTGRASTV